MSYKSEVYKSEVLSRALSIDLEKCVEQAGGNRYNMVLMASARVRELRKQQAHSSQYKYIFPIITSLLDIQDGKVGEEYLFKK
jgi:DNA-directed RNA polymerase subunit K/omega